MTLNSEEVNRIIAFLGSSNGPRWITATRLSRLKQELNLREITGDAIDASLDQFALETNGQILRKSRLPSNDGSLEILWGHTNKVNRREVASIFREDNPLPYHFENRLSRNEARSNLFFSHNFKDTDAVVHLAKELENHSIFSWLAEMDIQHGSNINQAVYQAIESCDVFGVYITKNLISSTWAAKEIDMGLNSNKIIVGFLDVSGQEDLNALEITLNRSTHELRNRIFNTFFSANSDVQFFSKNLDCSQTMTINTLEINVSDWSVLSQLSTNRS
ncbi:MAG: toll/interleukin-1 receptor domain-containing protein [Bacteroidota bacterium]